MKDPHWRASLPRRRERREVTVLRIRGGRGLPPSKEESTLLQSKFLTLPLVEHRVMREIEL